MSGGSASQAQSNNNVSVEVGVANNIDTQPLAAALSALTGVQKATADQFSKALQQGQDLAANSEALARQAIASSNAATTAAVQGIAAVVGAQQQQAVSTGHVEIAVAVIGLLGALIAAHFIRLPRIKL